MDSLGDDSVSDLLVDDNSDRSWVYIEDSSCSSMIVFVRHAFVNGTIDYNIDNISNFVGGECLGNMDSTMLFESLFEFVSSSSFVSVAMSHGSQIIINNNKIIIYLLDL
jgi:hypothetical protein